MHISHNFILNYCSVCQRLKLRERKKEKENEKEKEKNKEKMRNKTELKNKGGSKKQALYHVKNNSITLGPALALTWKQKMKDL